MHKVEISRTQGKWLGVCTCRDRSDFEPTRHLVELWEDAHHKAVERARTHLNDRRPSLRDQYDYYRKMENDPSTPESDRALWHLLADGLQHRLGVDTDVPSMF